MILSVANYKGGVGKTTTAMHLAAFMAADGPTVLVDSDATRTATKWAARSTGLPFSVIPSTHIAREARAATHIVIDQEANPNDADFRELVTGCDLMVVPCPPGEPAVDGLAHTLERIHAAGGTYRVLLTIVPPAPSRQGAAMREKLNTLGLPVFKAEIPRLAVFEWMASEGLVTRLRVKQAGNEFTFRHLDSYSRAWGAYSAVWAEVRAWQSSLV